MTGIMMLMGSSPNVIVSISANPTNTSGGSATNDSSHTATATGGTPSTYSWGILSGSGSIVSGGTTSNATVRVTDDAQGDLNPSVVQFYCDMVVNGITYRATLDRSHNWT